MEEKEPVFKTPNDIHTVVTVDDQSTVLDEKGCTVISIVLKNTGDIATSFLGAHNPDLIRILEKATKKYLKSIKRTLKKGIPDEGDIEVHRDTPHPEENKLVEDTPTGDGSTPQKKSNSPKRKNTTTTKTKRPAKKPNNDSHVSKTRTTTPNKIGGKKS